MNLSGNTILITGGATGIGFEMAKQFDELGNEVIICGRREGRLMEAKEAIPALHTITCDVSTKCGRETLMNEVKKNYPCVNILVNNAGIQQNVDLSKGTEDLFNDDLVEIDINLKAPIFLSGMFIEFFKENSKKAAIINVSSGLGFAPIARAPIYCATKAALHSYTLTLRHQLKDSGIDVIEIVPPIVVSELNSDERAKTGANKFATPAAEFVTAIIEGIKEGRLEIGYGSSEAMRQGSRALLDAAFERMNSRH